jgi:hypothetical protein
MVRAVSDVLKNTNPKESAVWEQWRAAHFPDEPAATPAN